MLTGVAVLLAGVAALLAGEVWGLDVDGGIGGRNVGRLWSRGNAVIGLRGLVVVAVVVVMVVTMVVAEQVGHVWASMGCCRQTGYQLQDLMISTQPSDAGLIPLLMYAERYVSTGRCELSFC